MKNVKKLLLFTSAVLLIFTRKNARITYNSREMTADCNQATLNE